MDYSVVWLKKFGRAYHEKLQVHNQKAVNPPPGRRFEVRVFALLKFELLCFRNSKSKPEAPRA